MERNKSQDKEIDILLSALDNEDEVDHEIESLQKNDVMDFINFFNIKPGENELSLFSLYEHYKNWSNDIVKIVVFNREVRKVFQTKKINNVDRVLIKNDLVELNNNITRIARAKEHLKKSQSYKKQIERFIQEMQVNPDDKWVNLNEIYKWYTRWRQNKTRLKINKHNFSALLRFYFESKTSKNRAFFKLKGEFNMEKIKQLRGIKNEEKEKQKTVDEVCGIKTGTESKDTT